MPITIMCETMDEIHAVQLANIIAKRREAKIAKQIPAVA
jgi:hypothetical protein